MSYIKLSLSDLATLSKKSESEVLNLTKNDDGTDKDEAEISKAAAQLIKDRFGEIGSENLGRGKREALTIKQKELAAKLGIDNKANIEELIDAALEAERQKSTTGDSAQLTEKIDEIKRLKEEIKGVNLKLKETEKAREKDKTLMRVEAKALAEIDKLNILWPADEKKAEMAKKNLLNSILSGNFKVDGDAIVPIDEHGEQLQDDSYEKIDFSRFVQNNNFLPTKQAQENTPNPPNPKGGGGNNGFKFSTNDLTAKTFAERALQLSKDGKLDELEQYKAAYAAKLESEKKV